MATFTVRRVPNGAAGLLNGVVPAIFVPVLTDRWTGRDGRSVYDVRVAPRTRRAWRAVGEELTGRLLARSRSLALWLDGTLAQEMARDWLDLLGTDESSAVHMRVTSQRYRVPGRAGVDRGAVVNVSWASTHRTEGNTAWSSMWRRIDSRWFNQACDLLLLFYDEDVFSLVSNPAAFDVTALEGTVQGASAWLVPVDDNIGFTVGTRRGFGGDAIFTPT